MKRIIIASFLFCLFCAFSIHAQTSANDYFHKSANLYINAQKPKAKETIQEALSKYPNDEKLKNLAEAIDQLPDPPENEQEQQNQNNQQNQEQQEDKEQQNQQQNQNQQQEQEQENQQAREPQLSKENAQQILDALLEDEKDTQEKMKKQKARSSKKVEKDW